MSLHFQVSQIANSVKLKFRLSILICTLVGFRLCKYWHGNIRQADVLLNWFDVRLICFASSTTGWIKLLTEFSVFLLFWERCLSSLVSVGIWVSNQATIHWFFRTIFPSWSAQTAGRWIQVGLIYLSGREKLLANRKTKYEIAIMLQFGCCGLGKYRCLFLLEINVWDWAISCETETERLTGRESHYRFRNDKIETVVKMEGK